jgi:hypothetical protein
VIFEGVISNNISLNATLSDVMAISYELTHLHIVVADMLKNNVAHGKADVSAPVTAPRFVGESNVIMI